MKNLLLLLLTAALAFFNSIATAQDSTTYKLRLSLSVLDKPQYKDLPYKYPSMQQSLELSNNFYDLGYRGIDLLGDKLIKLEESHVTPGKRLLNKTAKYLLSLGFVKYGSELPVPLGVWAHEEFHRAVLGVNGLKAKNGNWLLNRWDGTVYGVTDRQLADLKEHKLKELLYAYVAGVQAENLSTRTNMLQDFYYKRTIYKNALYLYNAYYTWDYLKYSTSEASNTVKTDAPPHEAADPAQRDFAGSDFTAWAYDMFNPEQSYLARDAFPNGEGVNRRVGFGDLSPEAQDFLKEQQKLSLVNFINPAIFFINRINLGPDFAFNFFGHYVPTHFGNDIGLQLPVRLKSTNLLLGLHRYSNHHNSYPGVDIGLMDDAIDRAGRLRASVVLHGWFQPEAQSFFDEKGRAGGAADLSLSFRLSPSFSSFANLSGKTAGWQLGNPYLGENINFRVGMELNLK